MDTLKRFAFSQSSLQDFVDCRRRFQLRYVQRVAWPALRSQPARENERHMQRGERFHRLVQQYLIGISPADLTQIASADEDENVLRWWQNFLQTWPDCAAPEQQYVEIALSAPFGKYRLTAKYDLIQIDVAGQMTIYDWKTSIRPRPHRDWLAQRLQTHVYPYLLVRAGSVLNAGRCPEPEQVRMIYWFAEPGQPPEQVEYNRSRYAEDERLLMDLIQEACTLGLTPCPNGSEDGNCRFCEYRSLCDRGVRAGLVSEDECELDEASSFSLSLEQIGEICF